MKTGRTSAPTREATASRCTLPASSAAPADLACSLSRSVTRLAAVLVRWMLASGPVTIALSSDTALEPSVVLLELCSSSESEPHAGGTTGQVRVPKEPMVLSMLMARWKAGCLLIPASSSRFWVSSSDMPVCRPKQSAADADAALRWPPNA